MFGKVATEADSTDLSLAELLNKAEISEKDYIRCIRSVAMLWYSSVSSPMGVSLTTIIIQSLNNAS